jgi:hypothetical protein
MERQMKINIDELFNLGTQLIQKEHTEAEKLKEGILRGGSSGAMILGGKPLGTCPRIAYGRFMGLQLKEDHDIERELMFSAGRRNEDSWYETLTKAYPAELILREEEIGISHDILLDNGKKYVVTGRPDIVLLDEQKKPKIGIELKLLCSLWTAKAVLIDQEPKTDHLIQAGFYSWKLGIPFDIWYTSHVEWPIMTSPPKGNKKRDWIARLFPEPGDANSEMFDYTWYRQDDKNDFGWTKVKPSQVASNQAGFEAGLLGLPKRLGPFRVGYETQWKNGQLAYRLHGTGEMDWVFTSITQQGIDDFYRSILAAVESDVLPPRASGLKADGTRANYSPCDYCKLDKVCSSYKGSSVKDWLKEVGNG